MSYRYIEHNKVVAVIDHIDGSEIKVTLECGYVGRFWIDFTDEALVRRCRLKKKNGVPSNMYKI